MDYMVKFIAAIDERKRPENFPRSVFAIGTYSAADNRQLAGQINDEMMGILQMHGMMISTDPAATIDMMKVTTEGRVFVPMHMITHFRTEVKSMSPMPLPVDTGVLDPQGKKIVEYETEGKRVLPS